MLIEKETEKDLPADWPQRYYAIPDPAERKEALEKRLKENPSSEDERRREIFQKRFRKSDDLFMEAWLLIRMSEQDKISRFNRNRKERAFRSCMTQLQITEDPDDILMQEWTDFARKWISTCLSRQYRTAAFGILTVKDTILAGKIAHEINSVTRDIPSRFSLQEVFLPFRKIMIDVYKETIEDSDEYFS